MHATENNMQKTISKLLKNPKMLFVGTAAVATLLHATGYCQDTVSTKDLMEEMDKTSNSIQNFLFSGTIRKAALTLGLGAGLFQAFMSGSIRPLLIYGGLGLAVCYLPKVVNWISAVV